MNTDLIREPKLETLDEVRELWTSEIPLEVAEVDQRAIWIASVLLEGVDEAYGKDSDTELAYHGSAHSRDVIRRSLSMWRDLHETLPERFPIPDLGLIAVAAAGHDRVQLEGPVINERMSARATANAMKRRGATYYRPADRERVDEAIMTTIVEFSPEGEIHQVNLRKGARDPLKLVLAYADINGIAMEGPFRMYKDATNLFMEISGITHNGGIALQADRFVDFLGSQAQFLETRLSDMPSDVAYYFPDSTEAFQVAFKMNTILRPHEGALELAKFMRSSPIMRGIIHSMSIGTLLDTNKAAAYFKESVEKLMHGDATTDESS